MALFKVEVRGYRFEPIIALLDNLARRAEDLMPLALQIALRIEEGNRDGLLAGTDAEGNAMAELSVFTLKDRDGDGPPLVPQGAAARAIVDFGISIEPEGRNALRIRGTWLDQPYIRFHRTGYINNRSGRPVPARNIVGIRPETHALILDDVRAAVATWVQ